MKEALVSKVDPILFILLIVKSIDERAVQLESPTAR